MITASDIRSLLPMEIIAGGMVLTMVGVALKRNHILTFICTLTTLAAAFLSIVLTWPETPHAICDLFLVDRLGCYFQALFLLSAFVVTILSKISLQSFYPGKRKEEHHLLLLLAALGGTTMAISTHFASFFI